MTGRSIVTAALRELTVIGATDTPSAEDAAVTLLILSRLIDSWNAVQEAIYADQFLTFTLTPNLQPHTLGPTGATWTTAQRPVSIEGATLVVGSVNYPMNLRQSAWWTAQIDPTLSDNIPTDLYYNATWPNGSLYFWPVPTASYDVLLQVRGVLTQYTLDTTFSMPPGYEDAVTLTLSEMSMRTFAKKLEDVPTLPNDAARARARIFANNVLTPPLATCDSGIPGKRGWFDWRSGLVR